MAEVELLLAGGTTAGGTVAPPVREIVLVAQDLASYGRDRSRPGERVKAGRSPIAGLTRAIAARVLAEAARVATRIGELRALARRAGFDVLCDRMFSRCRRRACFCLSFVIRTSSAARRWSSLTNPAFLSACSTAA